MASSIHYKFKSSLDFAQLKFDGPSLSLAELKRIVVEKSKFGKADYKNKFDIEVTNFQTKEGTVLIYLVH